MVHPSSTAQGTSQEIYFQLTAPSSARWMGVGQGSSMSGANMFIISASGDGNVTVSPRLGSGHQMPEFNANAQVTVLEGTSVQPDGSLRANVRCDSCLSWSDGSTSTQWIHIAGYGGSSNKSLSSTLPDTFGSGLLPLASTDATGPIASSAHWTPGSSSSSSSSSSSDNTMMIRRSHAIIMSLIFLFLFPVAALTLYLPYAQKVLDTFTHRCRSLVSLVLLIIGPQLRASSWHNEKAS
ncbi:hypothetical protein ABVK25_012414 [Lepraria finkii]|uniref:DOMON domain-containing protein n=1 Tax=Lepraria finkii TaxID=1340010 RepID=A0ABR4AFE2_9LECA